MASGYRYDDPAERVIATRTDQVARAASTAIGGAWGEHARAGRQRFFTPVRVLLLMATITIALAWIKQRPCAFYSWQDGMQYTHMCYSDAIPLWGIEGISDGAVPYFSMDPTLLPGDEAYSFGRVEYPVLTGFFMWAADKLSAPAQAVLDATNPAGSSVNPWAAYFVTTCLLLALCYFAVVYFTARTTGRRVWDTAIVALAPIVVVHAFTNWDVLPMALLAAAMFAWSRQRPLIAGMLIGLGAAAKLYPLLMLGALLVLAIRTARWRGFGIAASAAALTWLAVNLPVALGAREGWLVFFRLNRDRGSDYATLWQVIERSIAGVPQFEFTNLIPIGALNTWTFIAMAAACAAITWLALAAPHRPRLASLVFLIVAAFLLTNKVWSAQYSLWLLPLAVLALPRWRLLLGWQLAEAMVWITASLWFLQRDIHTENQTRAQEGQDLRLLSGADYEWVALFVVARCVLIMVMMGLVVRDILRPEADLVRAVGQDDPSGGMFDGAPDVVTIDRSHRHAPAHSSRHAPGAEDQDRPRET